MRVKKIIDEDFTNYKQPCTFICTCFCTGKCYKEQNLPMSICQNSAWQKMLSFELDDSVIIQKYFDNPISKAICFGGLEPFEQVEEIVAFVQLLRLKFHCHDDVVIYTGYTKDECFERGWLKSLSAFDNIIIKFGRYIPNQKPHYDKILGVWLASDNQYAVRLDNIMDGK